MKDSSPQKEEEQPQPANSVKEVSSGCENNSDRASEILFPIVHKKTKASKTPKNRKLFEGQSNLAFNLTCVEALASQRNAKKIIDNDSVSSLEESFS